MINKFEFYQMCATQEIMSKYLEKNCYFYINSSRLLVTDIIKKSNNDSSKYNVGFIGENGKNLNLNEVDTNMMISRIGIDLKEKYENGFDYEITLGTVRIPKSYINDLSKLL